MVRKGLDFERFSGLEMEAVADGLREDDASRAVDARCVGAAGVAGVAGVAALVCAAALGATGMGLRAVAGGAAVDAAGASSAAEKIRPDSSPLAAHARRTNIGACSNSQRYSRIV